MNKNLSTNPNTTPKLSPLFDTILLEGEDITQNKIPLFLSKIDWKKILLLYILPIFIILIVLFYLKERYDKKQEFENEYGITDELENNSNDDDDDDNY